MASITPINQRDGRNSNRQGTDTFDERMQLGILWSFIAEKPAPKPVVFAMEEPFEDGTFLAGRTAPDAIQITAEQLIQFAHATPASPA
jgi:hypothetical protein